jgi:predicted ester cyclase
MSATSDLNKANATRFFERVFNQGDMDIVDALLGPDYRYNGQPTSADATKGWAQSLRAAFPDLHFTIETILAEDDQVGLRWRMTGTRDGKKLTNSGTNILVFAGGQAISNDQGGGSPADFKPVGA